MTPVLLSDLEAAEGLRLVAYPDPITGSAPWTIGYGHTGAAVHPGLTWTRIEASLALRADVERAAAALDQALPWWRMLDDVRQDCMAELCFNMGIGFPAETGRPGHGLRSFGRTLEAIRTGRYADAAEGLRASHWALEVGARAERLARMMRDGVRPTD